MNWVAPLLVIFAFVGTSHGKIASTLVRINSNAAHGFKRQVPPAPILDVNALENSPQMKSFMDKLPEIMKNPKVQEIMKNPKVVALSQPESLKKILESGVIEKLLSPDNVKQLLESPQGKQLVSQNEHVKQFVNSDMFKVYVSKLNEILPQLIGAFKVKVNAMLAAKG